VTSRQRRPLVRVIWLAVAAGAAWFALAAGEYSTLDLFRQRERRAVLVQRTDSLARVVDSLKRYREAIRTDPAVQERIAREEFGMVKGSKELLYRFAEPETGSTRDRRGRSP
jgi:cell division protein FtsB